MSRRRTKKTRLVYCEGAQDKAFLDCLKRCYGGDVYNVDIKRGAGGNQVHLVEEARKKGSVYDQIYLKLDGDRSPEEMAAAEAAAEELGVNVLRSVPAIERLLLAILEPRKRVGSWDSVRLKRYFEEKYIPRSKRTDSRVYETLFTADVLEEAKERLPELRALIKLF